jgi:maltooligosyltrehalose trehalohydrolase
MEPIVKKRVEVFEDAARRVGATYVLDKGVHMRVWAPEKSEVQVQWLEGTTETIEKSKDGYFKGFFPNAKPGDLYSFVVDGKVLPDPASRSQPRGVTGPSEVLEQDFSWTDQAWKGVPYHEWVIYEIHTGTFSEQGTFDAIIEDLPRLRTLGVTTLEIMPVSPFPGLRNWGYDGVFPHGVQHNYGGPRGLKNLVNACHDQGIAVILDVVFNHMGPEGDVLPEYGPYFQSKYKTPWGASLNYDGAHSEHVRNYFLQAVWQWLTEFHFDGLRLDAVHTIFDTSPIPFLEEMTMLKRYAEKKRGYPLILIAESDMNDSRLLAPPEQNGNGMDAHRADDLHHILHVLLTGETGSYYVDYTGGLKQLADTYRTGVYFQGEYSFSRGRCHGRSYNGVDPKRFIVETQNHDQIGNRIHGKRLNSIVGFDKIKLCAASIFLSPCTPLFFMGEEFASDQPFHYFINHEGEELKKMIREGRNNEFDLTMEEIDPADEELFTLSTLKDKSIRDNHVSSSLYELYKDLISLSKRVRKLKHSVHLDEIKKIIVLSYDGAEKMSCVLSFNDKTIDFDDASGGDIILSLEDYGEDGIKRTERKFSGSHKMEPYSAIVIER